MFNYLTVQIQRLIYIIRRLAFCRVFFYYEKLQMKEGKDMNFLYVALGGAVGAVSRYGISLIPVKSAFPILTLVTNIIGAVLIGFVVGLTERKGNMPSEATLFWKTGVCGGFTTFSTFSLEAFNLFDGKRYVLGGIYVALSLLCCIVGVICGKKIAEAIGI